ncbi:hypothetical protein SRB5_63340 [Streptomyces sp. RB5]|uniref:Uncharacterized protein n=1 Tax=Streptomyces smaragdinus TaxID=2585196 RepID=A0A7K0CRS1_9ACTN|nr:hypothetical protein [Streptomyces smaragdinus]MQY16141.1 hypothetical protein [Streptomyces smaragdinus]
MPIPRGAPAPNPVAFVHNPHTWADPEGLTPTPGCGIDDDTWEAIERQYGTDVADGVNHNFERMTDGTKNGPDHSLAGIGNDPQKLADYLNSFKGKMTHIDTKGQGSRVAYDASRVDSQGRGVLIVQTPYRISAYHYSQDAFESGRYVLP